MEEKIDSLKWIARLAGLFWLLNVFTTGFSLGYVRSALIVAGDAAATANNITAHESLFRLAIASNLFAQTFLFFLGLTVFSLFERVNKTLAIVFLTSVLISVAIAVVNSLNNIAALAVLGKAEYLNVFTQQQLNAIMMLFLGLNNSGQGLLELFWAPYLLAFGLLIIKSKYMPRILGFLLVITSLAFPLNTFTKLLVPQFYPATFTRIAMMCGAVGAIPLICWLLVKGVEEQSKIGET
jgi:hypothetical protein